MAIYTYSNSGRVIEIPESTDVPLTDNNQQLSHEEFKAALQRLADLSRKFDRPDAKPLSDYAISRESIYEGHPKL
ncbi:hypothetical protein J4G08_08100 [Candidatus Poribacteria bacterium]|nr:hypothetical protein [Candidatus Poribacteria bacterium]